MPSLWPGLQTLKSVTGCDRFRNRETVTPRERNSMGHNIVLIHKVRDPVTQTYDTLGRPLKMVGAFIGWHNLIMIIIVSAVSRELVKEIRPAFFMNNLWWTVWLAEVFSKEKILHTVCAKLNWSHLPLIIYIDDDLKRDFYAKICRIDRWDI